MKINDIYLKLCEDITQNGVYAKSYIEELLKENSDIKVSNTHENTDSYVYCEPLFISFDEDDFNFVSIIDTGIDILIELYVQSESCIIINDAKNCAKDSIVLKKCFIRH